MTATRRRGDRVVHHRWIAAVLGLLTVVALAMGHRDVGYTRDEGIYFAASRSYGAWATQLVHDPARALQARHRDRAFQINHEHPALLKLLAGIGANLLAEPPMPGTAEGNSDARGGLWPVMPEGAAMRLPAQLLAGVAVALLYLAAAATGGVWAGVLAAGAFIALPRVVFHAGLHAFDVPVAVAILVVVLAYRKALRSPAWGWGLGVLLGLAVATKHNALFVGPLLVLHYYVSLAMQRWRDRKPIARGQYLPLPLVSMGVFAPLVAFALWPWLWSDPVGRVAEYLGFHGQHAWYNTEFLGHNYNQPPMPIAYPAVMTWATVPVVILVLAVVGMAVGWRRTDAIDPGAVCPRFAAPLPGGGNDRLLYIMFALFPLALISLPSTPIFGGTKHWLTAYPFFALLAARAWTWLWAQVEFPRGDRARWLAQGTAALLCLAPGVILVVDGHPYNLSQYAAGVGGTRGAAQLGLLRGFWGYSVAPILPQLPERLGGGTRLYPHDIHELAIRQYRREGRWPDSIEAVPLSRADAGLIVHERHMATWEIQLWDHLGTTVPVEVVSLDGVPVTSVYRQPTP